MEQRPIGNAIHVFFRSNEHYFFIIPKFSVWKPMLKQDAATCGNMYLFGASEWSLETFFQTSCNSTFSFLCRECCMYDCLSFGSPLSGAWGYYSLQYQVQSMKSSQPMLIKRQNLDDFLSKSCGFSLKCSERVGYLSISSISLIIYCVP